MAALKAPPYTQPVSRPVACAARCSPRFASCPKYTCGGPRHSCAHAVAPGSAFSVGRKVASPSLTRFRIVTMAMESCALSGIPGTSPACTTIAPCAGSAMVKGSRRIQSTSASSSSSVHAYLGAASGDDPPPRAARPRSETSS
eukprot:scaffold9330_cov117-Isochrysis_galbana.AAC.8